VAVRPALKRRITLLAWHTWQRLDSIMPRSVRFLVATAIGEVLFWILPAKRAATLANMAQVLGPQASPAAVRQVARRSFRNFAKYLSEFAHLPRWAAADLEHLMTSVSGWHHIEDAVGDGKGVIFVATHSGNWDVAGWYFGQRHAFSAVVEPLQPPELDVLVQGWRRAKHIGIIPLAHAARGVLRSLQQGGMVALVVDRPTHAQAEGVAVRFFGEWTRVPAGAAHFALRTGAPVVVAGTWRTPANTYAGYARPPLRFTRTADGPAGGDPQRDVQRVMQRIMEEAEAAIRAHPDQWYMFRHMWPVRPSPRGVGRPALAPSVEQPLPLPPRPTEAAGAP
jgi:KDO2-lipid IV(A) lauroyltransferase